MTERPLEIRQMDALKDWLRDGPWTVREAACLLAGVLPPARMGDSSDFGGWLPGREAWAHAREAWQQIVTADVVHIEKVLLENGPLKGAEPQDFLSLASRLKIIPPWLDAAREDDEVRAFLPLEALKGHAPPKGTMTAKEVAAQGGKAKRDKDAQRTTFFPAVREMVLQGKRGADIIRKLDAEHLNPPPDSTVYGWIAEIKPEVGSRK